MRKGNFEGGGRPIVKYVYGRSAVSCAKMAVRDAVWGLKSSGPKEARITCDAH